MKNSLAFALMAAGTLWFSSCSTEFDLEESDVPKDLLAEFKTKYPTATQVEWEAEKEGGKFYYEAEWKEEGKDMEVHISPDGTITPEE